MTQGDISNRSSSPMAYQRYESSNTLKRREASRADEGHVRHGHGQGRGIEFGEGKHISRDERAESVPQVRGELLVESSKLITDVSCQMYGSEKRMIGEHKRVQSMIRF